jgi:hypothetical protein
VRTADANTPSGQIIDDLVTRGISCSGFIGPPFGTSFCYSPGNRFLAWHVLQVVSRRRATGPWHIPSDVKTAGVGRVSALGRSAGTVSDVRRRGVRSSERNGRRPMGSMGLGRAHGPHVNATGASTEVARPPCSGRSGTTVAPRPSQSKGRRCARVQLSTQLRPGVALPARHDWP